MVSSLILPFIRDYLALVSEELSAHCPAYRLSGRQTLWLSFCLSGILLTNTICWKQFERASLGGWMLGALSWMFRQSKIPWGALLESSIQRLLKQYEISKGVLVLDDTDRERSKNARHLYKLGKQKDKKSGGYFHGQSIVFLLLVSGSVSIPVGFKFYEMDPTLKAWRKEDTRLKKKGVKKKHRPTEPSADPRYPTKNQLAIDLVRAFCLSFGHIQVKAILADALFGTAPCVDTMGQLSNGAQVISQIRKNQKIRLYGVSHEVEAYFSQRTAIRKEILIRGAKPVVVYYSSIIAQVEAHGTKRLIIALKYEGEAEFRYLIGRDMTWRAIDLLECFTLRWLIEVFFQDWKMYEGWGQLTKHVGAEGSRRSLILSLLFDHCLLTHPTQAARIKDKLPLYTVGSLRDKLCMQSLLQLFEHILEQPKPREHLEKLIQNLEELYELRVSAKHCSGRNIRWVD